MIYKNEYGVIPVRFTDLFQKYVRDRQVELEDTITILRTGIERTNMSFVYAVLWSVNDEGFMAIKKEPEDRKKRGRKSKKEREEIEIKIDKGKTINDSEVFEISEQENEDLLEIRRKEYAIKKIREIIETINMSVLRQELYDMNNEQIKNYLKKTDLFWDSKITYRLFEEYYNVNIYVLNKLPDFKKINKT